MPQRISLCDESQVWPIFTPAWIYQRTNPSTGPAVPVNDTPNAYLSLREIKRLIQAVLDHLGVPATPFTVGWSPRISHAHGETGPEVTELGRAKATRMEALMTHADALMAALTMVQRQRSARAQGQALELLEQLEAVKTELGALAPGKDEFVIATRFNKAIFDHVTPAVRYETVIHEACHLAAFVLDAEYLQDAKEGGHGPYWREMMRMCGMVPNATAEPVEGVHCFVRCPGCAERSSVSDDIAGDMLAGDALAQCRKCGTEMGAEDLSLPEGFTPPPRRLTVQCPNCGNSGQVPEDVFAAVKRGEGHMACPACGVMVSGQPERGTGRAGSGRKMNIRKR